MEYNTENIISNNSKDYKDIGNIMQSIKQLYMNNTNENFNFKFLEDNNNLIYNNKIFNKYNKLTNYKLKGKKNIKR